LNNFQNKKNEKSKPSSNLYNDISKINEIVDKIIEKPKQKLDKETLKEFDFEKISIRNKKGDFLYYLRKKPDKKNKEVDTGLSNANIISDIKTNIDEEPGENNKEIKEFDFYPEKKPKKRNRFGIKSKIDNGGTNKPQTNEDIIKSKEFDEVFTDFTNIQKKQIPVNSDEDAIILDKKILETLEIKGESQEKDYAAEKVAELAEKHDFFKKTDTNKKGIDWLSYSTDNLAELKKKYNKNITITDFDPTEVKELNEEELEIQNNKILEAPIIKESNIEVDKGTLKVKKSFFWKKKPSKKEDKLIKIEEFETKSMELSEKNIKELGKKDIKSGEVLGKSKTKRSFFKKEKSSINKDVKDDLGVKKPKKEHHKPIFRVDKILNSKSLDEEEKQQLDDNIAKSTRIVDIAGEADKGEIQAIELDEKHLKEISKQPSDKKPSIDNKNGRDIEIPVGVSLAEEGAEHEHVFFDEKEASSGGWSPQISDKIKKDLPIPLTPEGNIDPDKMEIGDIELPKEILQTNSVKLSELGFSEKEWDELDFYILYEPFAYVEILRERESLDKCYFLVEIALTEEEEKLIGFIQETMSNIEIDPHALEEKSEDGYLLERLEQVIEEYNIEIGEESKNKIFYYIGKTCLGLGKLDPLMRDPNIEDISCDGSNVPLFLYHRKYGSLKSNVRFENEDELSGFVFKLAQKCGKQISIAEPMLDATMPDGSRIQMTLSDEITAKGSTFTIRKFRDDPFSPPDLVEFNTMSAEMIAYMWIAIENGINTLFAGGTASGKTTALNALTLFIPRESKIVSIEETREINLPHPNWIPGVARSGFGAVVADKVVGEIDMYDLMKAALRQRPEYIIVGEIRGKEAYVLFQAMATGHATYSTAHADSAPSLIHRLEGKPISIPRVMLQSLDIVCLHVITRVKNIRARRCKQIIEIIDIDPTTKEILTNEVFRWDPVEDKFIYSGKSYILERVRAEKDITREEMTLEIKNRKKIIEWMNQNNVREFRDVSNLVAQYCEDPIETIKKIERGVKKIDA
jgi:flagellar protein FlaI